jgi:predicted Zn-dependent protease
MGAQVGVALPHSRFTESEADRIGLIYMARAGYNPEAAVAFWQRFAEFNRQAGGSTPWFLRTHPLDETDRADPGRFEARRTQSRSVETIHKVAEIAEGRKSDTSLLRVLRGLGVSLQ